LIPFYPNYSSKIHIIAFISVFVSENKIEMDIGHKKASLMVKKESDKAS